MQPILEARCIACHGPDAQEGRLRLDARSIVMKGGVSGPAIVPGDAERSLLLRRVLGLDDQERMPLDEAPLSDNEIGVLRRWIAAGADWPAEADSSDAEVRQHWAYIPSQRPELPAVENAEWLRTPLDAFILHRLEAEGLSPSPDAEKAKLLRRLSLDLTGLPPLVEEVEAFLADESPEAYRRAVDRLLASPAYGERWARPWLDLARYADSNGYQADQYREVWPYRDWVIWAMNADMPFTQFTREQIAGDLLPGATPDQKIATGFHRLTTCNVEAGVDPEENRVNQIIDRVNTTGFVWLGTSIECAQCHNHKYDPISQKDYYRLFAYFNNTPLEVKGDNGINYDFYGPKMELPLDDDQADLRRELQAKRDDVQEELDAVIAARAGEQAEWEQEVVAAKEKSPQWTVLDIAQFESSGGASHTILDDKSVLVGGKTPDKDIYTVIVPTDLAGITGFRLETLTDPSLPGNGPGRHHPERPNFVLYEFEVTAAPQNNSGEPQPISLHGATADFSQGRWPVAGAIDGDMSTGWAINPEFGKPHQAEFLAAEPLGFEGGAVLTFTLHQHYGGGRTIGRLRLSAMQGDPAAATLPENLAKIVETPEKKRTKKQREELREHFLSLDPQVKELRDRVAELDKKLDAVAPPTTLVMVEDKPRMTHVFKRGEFLNPGEPVEPGTPHVLHDLPADAPQNRLALADWLTDEANPLTARVTVNRWWAEFFGQGLVTTEEDFGTQGEPPTHPELLDWLAVEFMESGWSQKHIHRLIVTSSVYRQSSRITSELLERDPQNKLYARGPRFRLSAEAVRDNALAISGLLSEKQGGPPVYPPQPDGVWRHVGRNAPKWQTEKDEDRFRRGLYVFWRRSAPYPSFVNFDAPDRAACVVQRPRTNTPLQALTLMNDPAYIEMAAGLATRILTDRPAESLGERIQYAFRLCVSRAPSDVEAIHLRDVYLRELSRFKADPQAAKTLLAKLPSADAPPAEMAAWLMVSNILLNLDETITKG
ncbi:MAG: PSD1 and planctomycete cytochrome C domain-containing protein [Planctomycetes bacterium]|nr:PSD1 and planctomycete cytochrome C domain-containing protein [Planctomycetota bacterium]